MPIIVLFIVYSSVKSNIILQDTDFLSLLMNHKGKFIFYFFVSFIEEVIFRGIIFGLLLQKCKNKYLSCVIAALIFTLPHIFNTDNISVLVMFIFPFLYGIFANEMFYTTKSIWMPTGFHWLWNYTITSLFLVTGTQTSVYKGYKRDKIEMRVDRVEVSDFPLYLNTVAGGLDRRDQTIGGFSFVVKIYAVPVVEIIGQLLYLLGRYGFNTQFGDCL